MRTKPSRFKIFAGVAVALAAGALALLVVLALPLSEGALGLLLILGAALLSSVCGRFLAARGTGRRTSRA